MAQSGLSEAGIDFSQPDESIVSGASIDDESWVFAVKAGGPSAACLGKRERLS